MRDAVRRVGAHLQAAHGYRGAFGIDGVLTADGLPAHRAQHPDVGRADRSSASVDRRFFTLLQANLVAGLDTGLTRRRRRGAWCR